ncbi:hypothetical protein ANO14919_055020 [Xylariales sp. No.14919]|nr:hypothetical protein ANO14919_055020 [Xylariales sp. No.14919]
MASNARDQLADLTKDTTAAAFNPLFKPSDVDTLTILYDRVINIATSALKVTFYCDSAFIDWSDPFSRWIDTAFTYTATDGSTKSVSLYKVGQDRSKKPGTSGSFTTLGYKLDLPNGDVADFSDQAHIMVSENRWNHPKNDGLDHRPLSIVNSDGLRDGYTALDQLKPLSETVFHELMHAVGGTVKPKSGRKRITDDPILPVVTKKIYGYKLCVEVNQARDDAAAIAQGASPLTRAECPMILAKALYLQVKKQKTYWSTGDVDRNTLRAAGIPPPSTNNKLRRKEIMWRA